MLPVYTLTYCRHPFPTRRSSDLVVLAHRGHDVGVQVDDLTSRGDERHDHDQSHQREDERVFDHALARLSPFEPSSHWPASLRSEEHTSELQSPMYLV